MASCFVLRASCFVLRASCHDYMTPQYVHNVLEGAISSSSKAGWHLPLAFLATAFLLYISLGLGFSEWLTNSQAQPTNALDQLLSPATINALYEDARLQYVILRLTETVARVSLSYGDSFESGGLKDFGESLSAEVARMRAGERPTQNRKQLFGGRKDRRGFFSDVASFFGGGKGADASTTGGGLLWGLFGGGGNSTGGIGGLLEKGLSGITEKIVGGLATPAYFLGIGLGMGAGNGLNITTADQSKAIATKIASASGA
ncbi:hypothetical protein P171DRAFT_438972 [Karstenula rhodostoma CBS 690.94]|uniref:Uncharacterized protein n=1 Tax=Karstenula rhodostoma CBS 690.94 TaxID=1392251 RepID=A0A9P4PW26_9PLEO|nr:hypothetical protein P171DRAFT_438972 [Karstenula rhodostoma CBS 690.94]